MCENAIDQRTACACRSSHDLEIGVLVVEVRDGNSDHTEVVIRDVLHETDLDSVESLVVGVLAGVCVVGLGEREPAFLLDGECCVPS